MTANNQLKNSIDKYLDTYNLYADHTTGKVYDEKGTEKGVFDLKEHSDGDDDGRIHVAFHVDQEPDLAIIPTLIIHF